MRRSSLLALPIAFALATPAAAMYCDDRSGFRVGGNVTISGGFHFGEPYTEEEIGTFDAMELKRQGYDVTRAERWNGCIRAWVKGADGRETQQFFDPNTYNQLDLTYRP